MPLITRRSSTRALPRVSVGRCGLIFENCVFVSQNWSRLIYASFSEAVNHATTLVPTLLWVRTLNTAGLSIRQLQEIHQLRARLQSSKVLSLAPASTQFSCRLYASPPVAARPRNGK